MTLLLGTRTREQVLISADGLSVSNFNNECFAGRTTLQKVFEKGRVGVAHHGDNFAKVKGVPLTCRKLVEDWDDPKGCSMFEAAQSFREHVRPVAAAFANGGFWVVGYCERRGEFECYRISLPFCEVTVIEEQQFSDGDGKQYLSPGWQEHLGAFGNTLKEQERSGKRVFGGHFHQLAVSESECSWVHRYSFGSLGVAELLSSSGTVAESVRADVAAKESMVSEMNRLKDALRQRARIGGKKRPTSLGGIRDHWIAKEGPDWSTVYQLIAIGDEAEHADDIDVSNQDAQSYHGHVERLLQSLPVPVALDV